MDTAKLTRRVRGDGRIALSIVTQDERGTVVGNANAVADCDADANAWIDEKRGEYGVCGIEITEAAEPEHPKCTSSCRHYRVGYVPMEKGVAQPAVAPACSHPSRPDAGTDVVKGEEREDCPLRVDRGPCESCGKAATGRTLDDVPLCQECGIALEHAR